MGKFADTLPMVLNRALDGILPPYRELFSKYDLTEQQWRVLRVLWETEGISSAELASSTLLPAPSLVGILDRLEHRGLLKRSRSTSDRRIVLLSPTELGSRIAREVLPLVAVIHEELRGRVSASEWSQMIETLEKITNVEPSIHAGQKRKS